MRMNQAVALLLALAVDAAVAQPAVTPGPSQPVKVTNDGSSPVPVTVNGGVAVSGPVTVGNSPANPVPVSIQGGTPVSVAITGTPVPTTVQGTATVTGSVNVSNQSLLVDVLNDSQNAPFNEIVSLRRTGTSIAGTQSTTVPAGQRLVVETITVLYQIESVGNQPFLVYNFSTGFSGGPSALGPLTRVRTTASQEVFVGSFPMKLRVNGGDQFQFFLAESPVGNFDLRIAVHGYLVPM